MNKIIKASLLAIMLTFGLNPLYASGNHDHDHGHSHEKASHKEITKADAKKEALSKIIKLVKAKKIENSWLNASVIKTDKKKYKGNVEWVFNFKNDSVENKKKQIIYVFVNIHGEVTGANYSGK